VIKQAWIAPDGAGCYHFCYHIALLWLVSRSVKFTISMCEGYQNPSQGCYFENIISRMFFEKRKSLNLEIW
jgi:hypothetical protein